MAAPVPPSTPAGSADTKVRPDRQDRHPKNLRRLGISGAIQHKAGMQDSECIICGEQNETGPIFEIADYGICGDLFKVTPLLNRGCQGREGCEVRTSYKKSPGLGREIFYCTRFFSASPLK